MRKNNNELDASWYEVLDPSGLARRAEFKLGATIVQPSTRSISGVGGGGTVEPRVMQVLLALVDAKGAVVTRDDLIGRCWKGQIVGDDAVTRVIGEIRRVARDVAAGSFAIETIPKTGYRLKADAAAAPGAHDLEDAAADPAPPGHAPTEDGEPGAVAPRGAPAADAAAFPVRVSRRLFFGIAAAVVATVGGIGGWADVIGEGGGRGGDPKAADLIARGSRILRDELPDSDRQGIDLFDKALRIDPSNAEAWGLLALAWRNAAEHAPPVETAAAVAACQASADRALEIDPRNGNALAALAKLMPTFGEWLVAERRLRTVLAIAPGNAVAISALGVLMQSVGRVREATRLSARAVAIEPMSPIFQMRRTYGLWNAGRLGDADRTIDRALRLWPHHPAIWNARAFIFAMTERPHAARAMLDDRDGLPPDMSERAVDFWRAPLAALSTRARADIDAASKGMLAVLARSPGGSILGICVAAKLGELDAAFAMAEAYLLRRGAVIGGLRVGPDQLAVTDQRWIKTMMLFIPPTAPMRADPRFLPLCREMGMVDYWNASRSRPDFLGGGASPAAAYDA